MFASGNRRRLELELALNHHVIRHIHLGTTCIKLAPGPFYVLRNADSTLGRKSQGLESGNCFVKVQRGAPLIYLPPAVSAENGISEMAPT